MTAAVPARAILASIEPDAPNGIDGEVTAVCFADSGKKICSERIILRIGGQSAAAAASAMESFLDAVDSTPQAVAVEGGIHVETHSLRTPEERHRAACRDHGLRGDAVP